MGLIKNVVGAISGIVGTLFSVILGIFGLGKKSEFFLELDESAIPAAAPVKEAAVPAPKAAEPEVAQPVAVAAAPQAPKAKATEGALTFATDFLVNPSLNNTSRRRPGPSLSPFANMAKEMKRSASIG
ncbi:MAG: hypothetical protein O3A14_05075 [Cyanobacteria bacterium]|nr:hypothetical protein [Cyanobacteriota bacterium]